MILHICANLGTSLGPIWCLAPTRVVVSPSLDQARGGLSHCDKDSTPSGCIASSIWPNSWKLGLAGVKIVFGKNPLSRTTGGSSSQLACIFMLVIVSRSWMHILVISGEPFAQHMVAFVQQEKYKNSKNRKNNNHCIKNVNNMIK